MIELHGDRIHFTHPLLASIHFAAVSGRAPQTRTAGWRRSSPTRKNGRDTWRSRPKARTRKQPAARGRRRAARFRGAIAAGADLAEQALNLTPADLAGEAHDRVLVAAELRYAAGNTNRALTLLEEALVRAPQGPKRAELLWSLGKITFEGQDTRVGLGFFRRALAETDGDDLLRARILESATFPAAKQDGRRTAQAYAREAAALAEQLGDVPTLARALAHIANFEFLLEGIVSEGFDRAVALEKELGGLELDYGPTAWYATTLLDAGEFERARPLLEHLCERGRETGDAAVHQPLVILASLEFEAGNWNRAQELAREAYDVAVQTGRRAAEPKGLYTLASIEAARGNANTARALAEQSPVLTDGRGWSSGAHEALSAFSSSRSRTTRRPTTR